MKRTTTESTKRTHNIATPQSDEEGDVSVQNPLESHIPRMKEKGGKIKPLTTEEMEARLFLTLASDSEIKNNKIQIKLGQIDSTNSDLPFDITCTIAGFISSKKDQSNFALCGRQNYLSIHTAHPLRRFSGLAGDLKRTCQGQKMAHLDLMQCFDDHLKTDGGYDKVLLTPLSPLNRLSMAIAMMQWAGKQTLKADKPACIKLAQDRLLTEFTSLKNNPANTPDELRHMLMTAIRTALTAPKGKTNQTRSLVFNMEIAKQLINVIKSDVLDKATQQEIFFEVLKAKPDDAKNIEHLEKEASQWSLEHLAVAMSLKPTLLLFYRLKDLSPSERPLAVTNVIQAILASPHVAPLSRYVVNIIGVCTTCLATLNHELTSETHSLICSILDLLSKFATDPSCANKQKSTKKNKPFTIDASPVGYQEIKFKEGYELGAQEKGIEFENLLTIEFTILDQLPYYYKGYVYRRMIDWIEALPDDTDAAELASALNSLFNINILNASQ